MFLGVLEYECVPAEDGGHEDLEFHVREILTYARPIVNVVSFLASSTRFGCFTDLGP